jgi:hypothetical protein
MEVKNLKLLWVRLPGEIQAPNGPIDEELDCVGRIDYLDTFRSFGTVSGCQLFDCFLDFNQTAHIKAVNTRAKLSFRRDGPDSL